MTSEPFAGQPSAVGGRRPHRPPPRPVEVVAVERLAPRIVSVLFGGDALADFPQPLPTAHIKVLLPDANGQVATPAPGPEGLTWPDGRPVMRTYTPRRYDSATNTLEVQFVLHGEGPAARFAAHAAPGHRAAIGGPGGRFSVDPTVSSWWIGGDESALPAIATLIEALPANASAQIHLEVDGPDDHIAMPKHPGVEIRWHARTGGDTDHWGRELLAAAVSSRIGQHTHVWAGCEASAVRRIRSHMLTVRSLEPTQLTTRGYWRLGETNHPDHDFGQD